MYRILLGALVLLTGPAYAESLRLLEPREALVRGEYYETLRDPYIRQYDESWTYGAALGLALDIAATDSWRLYYDPTLKFRSTESQIRQGGLVYQTGFKANVNASLSIDVFRWHESLHVLDTEADRPHGERSESSSKHYPLVDSYGMELKWRLGH